MACPFFFVAGFDVAKLNAVGEDLAADPTEWRCARDEVTGLIREVLTTETSTYHGARSHADMVKELGRFSVICPPNFPGDVPNAAAPSARRGLSRTQTRSERR